MERIISRSYVIGAIVTKQIIYLNTLQPNESLRANLHHSWMVCPSNSSLLYRRLAVLQE